MTVGGVGSMWKTGGKFLPEIHASRLSVSGSLRPKIGLLILCVLVVMSVVLVVVPLVTRRHQQHKQESRIGVEPGLVLLGDYLRSLSRLKPNCAVSPLGLVDVIQLIERVGDEDLRTHLKPYLSNKPYDSHLHSTTPFFSSNLTLQINSDVSIPVVFKSDRSVSLDIKRIAKSASNQLSVISNYSVNLGPFPVLSGEFFKSTLKPEQVEMVVLAGQGTISELKQGRLVDLELADQVRMRILVPHSSHTVGSALEDLESILTAAPPYTVDTPPTSVIIKLPRLNLVDVYGGREVLRELGLTEIFAPDRVVVDSHTFSISNITHLTSLHLLKGNASADSVQMKDAFVCDRPFLYNILLPHINLPVVSGLYMSPQPSEPVN